MTLSLPYSLSTVAENMYGTRKELLLLGDFNMDRICMRIETKAVFQQMQG